MPRLDVVLRWDLVLMLKSALSSRGVRDWCCEGREKCEFERWEEQMRKRKQRNDIK